MVVLPLFSSLVTSFPGAAPLLAATRANHTHWAQRAAVHEGGGSSNAAHSGTTSTAQQQAQT